MDKTLTGPRSPILVTGMPRSGTTWIGRILAEAPGTHYLHEPFNISARACTCGTSANYWFYYVKPDSDPVFLDHLSHTFQLSLNRFNLLKALLESWESRRVGPIKRLVNLMRSSCLVIKEPLAIFSSEILASTFDARVVITIRHPAAVASSYRRLQWSHPFAHFLNQPLLMQDYLYPFEEEIQEFVEKGYDIVDQAALLWKLVYHAVLGFQQTHEDWLFVRHEDLAADPLRGFELLFQQLDLEYGHRVKHRIEQHSSEVNPTESRDPYNIALNSGDVVWGWKKRLCSSEIDRIRERVGAIGAILYPDPYWRI